ncbi:unnamed protein product [Camellia sinensis]
MAIQNRLNTGDRLRLFGISTVTTCPFCLYHTEDHSYLFFNCPFSEKVWMNIKSKINVAWPVLHWSGLVSYIAKSVKGNSLGSIIPRLALNCTVYLIWLDRNNRVFTKQKIPEEVLVLNIVNMVRFRVLSLKILKRNSNDSWFLATWRLPSSILRGD